MSISIEKNAACSFTGHRSIPAEISDYLFQRTIDGINYLYAHNVKTFLTGGAVGFDTIAAKAVIRCREEHGDIRLILVVPCEDQAKDWKQKDVEIYRHIKELADEVICLSKHYYRGCMHERNRYLVDNSSVCICYLIQATGGTAYTVRYARNKGLSIFNLANKKSKPTD